jgi:uncharacterized iron-regulated membrane protein
MLFWIHLALGLTAGTATFTMSVTGALLALQPQMLQWLERDQRLVVSGGREPLPPSALIGAALPAADGRADPVSLTVSADPAEAVLVSLGRDRIRYVDPYTGSVTGEGARGARRFFRVLTEFHRWLAAPAEWRLTARFVTGWSTLAFVALVVSGFVLWIPRRLNRASLARSVRPGWAPTPKARHFNWHTVVGFWCAPVLLILACTGVVLAFPWANRLLYVAAGTPQSPPLARPAGATAERSDGSGVRAESAAAPDYRTVDAAWSVATARLPTWQTIAIRIPASADGPVSFTITDATHWNRFARSQLVVSGSSGAVLRWEPYSDITRGQRWRGWARFAHTGELFGLAGQLLAGLASAGAALLVWTGMSLAFRRLVRASSAARGVVFAATRVVGRRTSGPEPVTQAEQN